METKISFQNHQAEKLVGTLHEPERFSGNGVIVAHCFTCSQNIRLLKELAAALAEEGFMTLRFDFSGNGRSEGSFADATYSKGIAEMHLAADLLMEKGADHLGFAGHSMGSAIAILAGAQHSAVKGVCGIGGRSSGLGAAGFLNEGQQKELEKTGKVSFTSRNRELFLTKDFFADAAGHDLAGAIESYPKPLCLIHGDKDMIIPPSEAHNAKELNPDVEVSIIEGADHMFSDEGDRAEAVQRGVEWLKGRF